MEKLKQLAFIGFNKEGQIAQVKQLSIDLKVGTDFLCAKQIIDTFLGDDSKSVKVVLCKNKELTFTSHNAVDIVDNLKQIISVESVII